jgi:hypothetical protein
MSARFPAAPRTRRAAPGQRSCRDRFSSFATFTNGAIAFRPLSSSGTSRREGLSSAARPAGGHNPLLFRRSKLFRRANQRAAAALRPSRLTCIGGVHADGDVAKLLPGALPACDFGFCIAEPPLSPRSRSAVAPKHKRAKADKTRGARYNSERVPAASSCVNLSAPNLPVAPSTDCAHNGDHGRTDQPSDIRRR